jgi:hypothetical protein
MDKTTIKTNLGLILQEVLAEAIRRAGFTSIEDYQYDPTCEKPDFLIPNAKAPQYMLEVHQTEARNSFQMKTLRAFTAVAESKAFYGDDLVSVNVLFGDPDNELPPSNVSAICGVFDVNLVPRKAAVDKGSVIKVEEMALKLAGDEDYKNKTIAAKQVITECPKGMTSLVHMLKEAFKSAKARKELFPLWKAERDRTSKLGRPPRAGVSAFYKRGLLGSLFLSDTDFIQLRGEPDATEFTKSLQSQLVATGLAKTVEEIDGDYLVLDPPFENFVRDRTAVGLRSLCERRLAAVPDMAAFFDDIRLENRRKTMCKIFVESYVSGDLAADVKTNLLNDEFRGIVHGRTWLVDLLTRAFGISLNQLSRKIYVSGHNPGGFGDPISHIAPKTARFRALPDKVKASYASQIVQYTREIARAQGVLEPVTDVGILSERLLLLRLNGAMKLRKLDPLLLVLAEECDELGLVLQKLSISSVIGDLASTDAVGRFELYAICRGEHTVLVNAVSVHDGHGDDKSKEWGARRLATLHRFENGEFRPSGYEQGLFVLDGEWEDKDVARLYRCGWNHVCRLGDVEKTLKKIFCLKDKVNGQRARRTVISFEGSDEDI